MVENPGCKNTSLVHAPKLFFDAPDVFLVQQYIASFLTFSSLVRESRWYGFVEHFFER